MEIKEENLNKSIEKVFRKYTLEVDDAIEAHGFKATSYIDYAEDTISELENHMKAQASKHGAGMIFIDLESNLKNTISNIVANTKSLAYERNEAYDSEKIDAKIEQLQNVLSSLNDRFLNSIEQI